MNLAGAIVHEDIRKNLITLIKANNISIERLAENSNTTLKAIVDFVITDSDITVLNVSNLFFTLGYRVAFLPLKIHNDQQKQPEDIPGQYTFDLSQPVTEP